MLVGSIPAAAQGLTEQVSLSTAGLDGNGQSMSPALSADGRYVAFVSTASNLVSGTISWSVFLRDRAAGTTECVSVTPAGTPVHGTTNRCSITPDGRRIVFDTSSDDLVLGHSTANPFGSDVYLFERASGQTSQVSVASNGTPGNGASYGATISADGRCVVFVSHATNLVVPDVNGWTDVYVRDLVAGTTERVNVSTGGAQDDYDGAFDPQGTQFGPPAISADGRYVAFDSKGTNLVAGDTNGRYDVFVRDRLLGTTERVSLTDGDLQPANYSAQPSIAHDGRYVAFWSASNDLVPGDTTYAVNVYVRDVLLGTTRRVDLASDGELGDGGSYSPSISADGRLVAFYSHATNLVAGDTNGQGDVFVRDLATGATTRASLSTGGAQGDHVSGWPGDVALSADGSVVAFSSLASNLAAPDASHDQDVFVHVRAVPAPLTYCTAKVNSQGCLPAIAASGTPSASAAAPFTISATNLINRRRASLAYALSSADTPFQGGTLCLTGPFRRTPYANSLGSASGVDCTGAYAIDFNARIQSGTDAALVPGTVVYAQIFFQDPFDAHGRGMTDALAFTIQP